MYSHLKLWVASLLTFYWERIKGTTIVARRATRETLANPAELQSSPLQWQVSVLATVLHSAVELVEIPQDLPTKSTMLVQICH